MRKILLILSLLILGLSPIMAGDRSEQQMRESAAKVLSNNSARRAASNSELKELLALVKLKIYGYDEGGFAIVTTDDRFEDVIGYSSSKFSENIPCGFKWWMESVEEVMEKANGQTFTTQRRARNRASGVSIAPLMTTTWGQERPYNDNCTFTNDGSTYQCVTGCVATALAQLMNYYKYPEHGTGSKSYDINYNNNAFTITFSEDFSQSVYDWGNMLDDYNSYRNTTTKDDHTKAVAKLMKDCGVATRTRYSDNTHGSSSSLMDVEEALKTYFYYDESTKYYSRSNYEKAEWMNMIYGEIDKGRPVLYCGSEGESFYSSGHAFVLHGYDFSGNVYINWGWDGYFDGYFDIDMLNPDNDNYNYKQAMVIAKPGNNSATPNFYSFNISAQGSGTVYYGGMDGAQIKEGTESYKIKEGNSVFLIFSPDSGNKIKTVKVNSIDVTSNISENSYTINSISEDTNVEVEFEVGQSDIDITQFISAACTGGSISQTGNLIKSGSKMKWRFSNNSTKNVTLNSLQFIDGETGNAGNTMATNTVVDANSYVSYTVTLGSDIHTPVTCRFKYTYNNIVYSIDAVYTGTTTTGYTLSIKSSGNGQVSYKGNAIRNTTKSYSVEMMSSATLTFTPDNGYQIMSVKVNNSDVTSRVSDNSYTISQITSNKSVEVEFEAIPPSIYHLTYMVDGEVYKSYEIEEGASITPEAAPTKEGYTFSGWSDIPSTMPNHDVTVTGTFTNNQGSATTGTVEINGIYYNLNGELLTAEITSSPNYYSGIITIPASVNYQGFTYQVTRIGEKSFYNCIDLSSVSISSTVTSIGNSAFGLCFNLSSIDLPNSIQDIGSYAFSYCKKLSFIIIPNGITTIHEGTFWNCSGLKSIKIPDTVTSFEGLTAGGVFRDCIALESISLSPNTTFIGSNCFSGCSSLTSIVIPDKVTTINPQAFYGCTNLKTVTIGKSVNIIISKAFAECKGLESVTCLAEDVPSANNDVFENSYIDYVTLYVPDASVNSYKSSSTWNQFGAIKGISEYTPGEQQPSNQTVEINGIYYNLIGKSRTAEVASSPSMYTGSVTIPATVNYQGITYQVTRIGENAFYHCEYLSSVSIPNSVTSIGNSAFGLCYNLSSIDLPNSIQDIGSYAFYGCKKLSSITIPNGITTIHEGTFSDCSGLNSIKIPDTVTSFEGLSASGVFRDCIALESISLSPNTTFIGSNCFSGCNSLTSIVVPDKVTTINPQAFYGCTNLKTVTIGKSVSYINSKAFAECKNLESVICLAEDVPSANSDAFENSYINNVTLYVSENSVNQYRNQSPWSSFGQIKAISETTMYTLTYKVDGQVYKTYQLQVGATITPEPDPTKDGYTFSGWSEIPSTMPAYDVTVTGSFERRYDVGNVVSLVNLILSGVGGSDNLAMYDMNNDGVLNIGDLILVVRKVLNSTTRSAATRAVVNNFVPDLTQYAAAQFILNVPENVSEQDINLVKSVSQTHQMVCKQIEPGAYAVVVYSQTNSLFKPEKGGIIEVNADNICTDDIIIQDIVLAKPTGETYVFDSMPVVTAISDMQGQYEHPSVYNLKGQKQNRKNGLQKGIYIENGKKIVVR